MKKKNKKDKQGFTLVELIAVIAIIAIIAVLAILAYGRIQEAMKEKPTIFVFGALHLIGAEGIVCLLRDVGYKVEQIVIK